MATRDRKTDYVGQIELALLIVAPQLAEEFPQHLRRSRHDSRIDLGDGALLRVRVALLHDRHHATVSTANDPAEPGWIGHVCRHDSERTRTGRGNAIGQRIGSDERHVAECDQHRCIARHGRERLCNCVACAQLLRLLDPSEISRIGKRGANLCAGVTDDDMNAFADRESGRSEGHG